MVDMKIGTGNGLRVFLTGVIKEGIKNSLAQKALTEKEKQVATGGGDEKKDGHDVDSLFGGDDESSSSSKTMDDESEKLKQGDIKAKDIVEKLNSIRSGRSFKDSSVSSSMEEYIDSLSKAEKVALLAFLKGISQIVTGEISANDATDPGDDPSDIKMDKSNEPHVVHKKPNVIKTGGSEKSNVGSLKKKGPPAEDSSAPAPITPKRR